MKGKIPMYDRYNFRFYIIKIFKYIAFIAFISLLLTVWHLLSIRVYKNNSLSRLGMYCGGQYLVFQNENNKISVMDTDTEEIYVLKPPYRSFILTGADENYISVSKLDMHAQEKDEYFSQLSLMDFKGNIQFELKEKISASELKNNKLYYIKPDDNMHLFIVDIDTKNTQTVEIAPLNTEKGFQISGNEIYYYPADGEYELFKHNMDTGISEMVCNDEFYMTYDVLDDTTMNILEYNFHRLYRYNMKTRESKLIEPDIRIRTYETDDHTIYFTKYFSLDEKDHKSMDSKIIYKANIENDIINNVVQISPIKQQHGEN